MTAPSAGMRISWLSRTLRSQMNPMTHESVLKSPGRGAR